MTCAPPAHPLRTVCCSPPYNPPQVSRLGRPACLPACLGGRLSVFEPQHRTPSRRPSYPPGGERHRGVRVRCTPAPLLGAGAPARRLDVILSWVIVPVEAGTRALAVGGQKMSLEIDAGGPSPRVGSWEQRR